MSNNRVLARSGFRFAYGLLAFTVIVAIALALSFVYWKPNSTTSGDKSSTTKPSVVILSSDMSLAQAQAVFGGAPTSDQLVPGSQLSQALPTTSQCQWVGDSATWAAFLCSG